MPGESPFLVSDSVTTTVGGSTAFASASQNSTIGPLLFTGSGSSASNLNAGAPDESLAESFSQFRVIFSLLAPHTYNFTSNQETMDGSFGVVQLGAESGQFFFSNSISGDSSESFGQSGVLLPQNYETPR